MATPYWLPPMIAGVMGPPRPSVREFEPLPPETEPLVSVIIPARNEAANIERCLKSLLSSVYRNMQIIVVDDRSTDGTRAIVEHFVRADARVSVIPGDELPKTWYGKPWACWQGFQFAAGSILLFTDADTEHGPQLLARTVAALEATRADMVTVMPRQEMVTAWERLVQPVFFLLLGLRFGSPSRLNRNRNPRNAIANGQYILVTRDSYEWVGGHRKVMDTVVEDLMLGVEYVKAGRRVFFCVAEEDMKTRMYRSLAEMREGWSKNFFVGMMHTFGSRALSWLGGLWTIVFLLGMFVLPLVMLVAGLVVSRPAWIGFGAAGYLGGVLLWVLMLRAGRAGVWPALVYPLGPLAAIGIIWRALRRGMSKIEWKGRVYSH